MSSPIDFIILASGNGTNANALLEFAKQNPAQVNAIALISDRENIGALLVAKKFGIKSYVISHKEEEKLLELLKKLKPKWAFLAGYKRIVGKKFLEFFWDKELKESRVLNVHPSLLPLFPGLNSAEKAFQAGASESGATIHFVDSGLDTGKVLLQESFKREKNETLESFENKIHSLEYKLFPHALKIAAEGKIYEELYGKNRKN